MNDIGYITETFKGSINETNIKTSSLEEVKYMLRYYEMAVEYHNKQQNPNQVLFFQGGINLINKILKQ